jgi:predicted Zn-dependent protease
MDFLVPAPLGKAEKKSVSDLWLHRVKYVLSACLVLAEACATSPTGRRQLMLIPDQQMNAMGIQAFRQIKGETPILGNGAINAYVDCVAQAITSLPKVQAVNSHWEVVVFDDKTVNAFALPGGKIGVYKGMFAIAQTPGQLAAVMGHEIGHVVARHGNERLSQQLAVGETLALADAWMAAGNRKNRDLAMAGLGVGAEVGILLPFSRIQESEADAIGQDLMARAGFDPRESVVLWENMMKKDGRQPPPFLSTHPSSETRITALQQELRRTEPLYEEATAAGHHPECHRPQSLSSLRSALTMERAME